MSSSYAGALKLNNDYRGSNVSTSQKQTNPSSTRQFTTTTENERQADKGPNPAYIPKTDLPESGSYVLTFLTNQKHHETLTTLRTKYFPKRLNHLEAHLTLFHALPGSKLEDSILPTLESTAKSTHKFHILASTPFKLNKGIAIGLPKSQGGDTSREIHRKLQGHWHGFLSDQDARGFKPHYTIMNKVDDEKEVTRAFEEVGRDFKAVSGTVEGLTLWLYRGPGWEWKQDFEFLD